MKIAFTYNLQRSKDHEEAEFDTSDTILSITQALASEGDEVVQVEMTRDGSWIQKLAREKPDLAFNTTEGFFGVGRESLAPIIFEQLQIPYVGSGPYCCFLTLDKFLTKQVVARRGVNAPEGYFISDLKELKAIANEVNYPVFVKPNFEGSSKGITSRSLCNDKESLVSYAEESLREFPEGILVERFIDGKDITVPFIAGLGEKGVLSPIEYTGPKRGNTWIYDYELKNELDEQVGVKCPADIPPESNKLVTKYMQRCVQALGVEDMGRADFRVTPSGDVYFIELNALPSLQLGAGIFEATKLLEFSYNESIQKIVSAAIKRRKIKRKRISHPLKMPVRNPKVALVFNLRRKHHGESGYELEAEFDSQETVDALQKAIESWGHEVVQIEATKELSENLVDANIDLVFNIAEGLNRRGREAQVPAICDLLGIEHTGSDATCLAVTLDKGMTTRLIASEGILTPKSKAFDKSHKNPKVNFAYPVIVKPTFEGTSKGVYDSSVCQTDDELKKATERLRAEGIHHFLVEQYIQGREFTVGIVGRHNPKIVGPMEIAFKKGEFPVYTFEAKQLDNQLDNEVFKMVCPVDLSEKMLRKVKSFAKNCFRVLGARDIARIDFRMDAKGDLYFIEMNPLPGLSPGFSDLTIMAERTGMKYNDLIGHIINPAVRRWRQAHRTSRVGL